jgi:hypothetical protein
VSEIAILVKEATPYVTAAVGAYGGAVLARTQDKTAGATVDAGARILQRVFGRQKAGKPLPGPLADAVAYPDDEEILQTLKAAIRKALERDAAMSAEVRALVPATARASITQNIRARRDVYASAGDMTIHQRSG